MAMAMVSSHGLSRSSRRLGWTDSLGGQRAAERAVRPYHKQSLKACSTLPIRRVPSQFEYLIGPSAPSPPTPNIKNLRFFDYDFLDFGFFILVNLVQFGSNRTFSYPKLNRGRPNLPPEGLKTQFQPPRATSPKSTGLTKNLFLNTRLGPKS